MKKVYCVILAFESEKDRDKYYNKKKFPVNVDTMYRPMKGSVMHENLENFLKEKELSSNNKTKRNV